ncbi:M48 family metalloprotease [Lacinutrix algicola]|uniref:M48 family metalloprotease n=1 Tax=Lacinutrix algicola TaxID=342954 RepID=UPI0006E2C103|nr:M48 family metalloprotease [Lacinutrix algicola]
MKKNSLTIFFVFYALVFVDAQDNVNNYIPSTLDSIENYLGRINKAQIGKIKGKHASKIREVYKDRDEKVVKAINDSTYYFNPQVKKDLDVILNTIYSANPEINTKDYSFFINNSPVPNAGCYGDGMFEINLGLFDVLESDDELSSIICHEIAHKLLEHSINNVSNNITILNSKETKAKVKKLKRKKYGQTRAALSIIDELSIDILDHSQEVEAQADSLGYVLFSKTKYSKSNVTSALLKLKKVDDMMMHHNVHLDSVFNFESYPFKRYWMKKTTSIFDTEEKINEFKLDSDTIQTHPEIEFRINKLITEFDILENEKATSLNQIKGIKTVANMQSIKYTVDLNFLDLAIYQLIEKYSNKKITKDFYYTTMATVLEKIYLASKNHKLGKYVQRSNNFSDEKQLNNIRLFIHNLELSEIAKIGQAFCNSNIEKIDNTIAFSTIQTFFNSITK